MDDTSETGLKVVMSVEEMSAHIVEELDALLHLRNYIYYSQPPSDDDSMETWHAHEQMITEWSNKMGGHIARAQKLAAAIYRWSVRHE